MCVSVSLLYCWSICYCSYEFGLGPNELSIADADLLPGLLAPDMPRGPSTFLLCTRLFSRLTSATVWDGRRNPDAEPNLIATRSREDHARKRVPWTHAFSTASVREYQPAIARRAGQLAEELEKRALAGETVDLVNWMICFA